MWESATGIDVTSAFKGFTAPVKDLVDEVHRRGWTVQKVNYKGDSFVATAKNPHGETQEGKGRDDTSALAHLLHRIMRQEYMRTAAQQKVGMWQSDWTDQVDEIAKAYAEAPAYDPKAAPAWQELARDSMVRFQTLGQQIEIEVVDDPVPYKTPQEMCEDVHDNKHIYVSSANSDHPVWTVEQLIAFRTVHDVLGHCVSGGDFGWTGENMACRAHFPLVSSFAQKALFTECIGQTAYGLYYRGFGPQKIVFLDKELEKVQDKENDSGHTGVNPVQTLAPAALPQIPSPEPPEGPAPVVAKKHAFEYLSDPNEGWESGVSPLPDNAYLWQRDPGTGTDPLDADGLKNAAQTIDTQWHGYTHPDGTPDRDTIRQAIINAFRAVLLSSRKDLRWNAIHFQHIQHIPASVNDPKRYWDTLEARREEWNQGQGLPPSSHKPYWAELQAFRQMVKAQNKDLNDAEIHDKADREFLHMWNEEEERVLSGDAKGELTSSDVEDLVAKAIQQRLKQVTNPKIDPKHDFDTERLFYEAADQPQMTDRYEPWMGNQVKAIAQLSRYADDLTDSALQDVEDHDASGHHFRKTILSLGIPGVGPKVVSHAWLLLQPMTSQLATIDPHTMEMLGHDYDEMSNRDYFKFERELQAGRDAAGYGHIPLGQFQWGMWDNKRTGPGTHQDYSPLRVLDPTPHDQVDWSTQPLRTPGDWIAPWWEGTQPYREQVAQDWDQNVATGFPHTAFPFRTLVPHQSGLASGHVPYFTHPDTGEVAEGPPGASLMSHIRDSTGLTPEQVWASDWGDLGKQ